jgi:ferrous iron transport protein B
MNLPDTSVLERPPVAEKPFVLAVAGNPNAGKTSLFNALTGLRAQTANFPGTTVEGRVGRIRLGGQAVELMDLPGMYSLKAATPEEQVAADLLAGKIPGKARPDGVLVMADADNLERSLFLISQILEENLEVVVALNMMDIADRHGIHVDAAALSRELGCPVVRTVARSGEGLEELTRQLERLVEGTLPERIVLAQPESACCNTCSSGCPFQSRYSWTEQVVSRCVKMPAVAKSRRTEHIDRVLTHPVGGLLVFMGVMLSVFYLIFSVASVPMDLIDGLFASVGSWIARIVPPGDFQSLLADGIIGGVGGILVFLPQICILFLFLALLEDSGYLARAAFVMDRLMRHIGLPGTAFVPLLSAHACAIPAIMATRVIRDPRDRLVTILVAPLMTCSARIPVYAMLTALLFPHAPLKAAMTFVGAYGLGIVAALGVAFVFKKTILPGESKPLVLELPGYKIPGIRNALLYTLDRAWIFIRQAGTIILVISIILWALATYPKSVAPPEVAQLQQQAEQLIAAGQTEEADALSNQADMLESRHALANSFAGRLGHLIEPIVKPLGYDWQIGIGIISSFAAREVIVSTLAVVYGVGGDADEDPTGLYETLRRAQRHDGSPVFTTATSFSLLIFYVLAMQCLPTQAVTRRETGSWKWAVFQLAYMTGLAYLAALITFQGLRAFGVS